jgi:hypothetical protein
MIEVIMIGGVIYAASSVVSALLFGMLARRQDVRIPRRSRDESLLPDIAHLDQLGFTEKQIARLLAYRTALRVGLIAEDLPDSRRTLRAVVREDASVEDADRARGHQYDGEE